MRAIGETDDGIHLPEVTGIRWRESWAFDWSDPETSASGGCRLELGGPGERGRARHWMVLDDERHGVDRVVVVAGGPSGGPLDLRAGEVGLRTIEPLRSTEVTLGRAVTLVHTGGDAFSFSMSGQRVDPGLQYYDSIGTATGTVEVGGRVREIRARSMLRHSWGHPTSGIRLLESLRAAIGDDVHLAVETHLDSNGRILPLGYLRLGEGFHGIEKARFRLERDTAGHVAAIDLLLATADRRDFRIVGTAGAASPPGISVAKLQLAGRTGMGVLEDGDLLAEAPGTAPSVQPAHRR